MSNSVNLECKLMGVGELVAVLVRAPQKAPVALGRAMFIEGNNIMREAKEQIPFRFGKAKGSGRVFSPEESGDTTVVTLGFGGAASKYVEVIHENRLNRVFRNGKKSKYLEDPFNAAQVGMEQRFAKRVAAVMGRML